MSPPSGRAADHCSTARGRCVSSVELASARFEQDWLGQDWLEPGWLEPDWLKPDAVPGRSPEAGHRSLFSPFECRPRGRPREGSVQGPGPNIPGLHAGGASHGRGVKHRLVRGRRQERCAGTQGAAFLLSTGSAGQPACPIHAGPSCVPGPPHGRPPTRCGSKEKSGRHPRRRSPA